MAAVFEDEHAREDEWCRGSCGRGGWRLDCRFCDACGKLHEAKGYCPICKNDCRTEEGAMLCCDTCDFWVHIECDGVSQRGYDSICEKGDKAVYHCPGCSGTQPGEFGAQLERRLPALPKLPKPAMGYAQSDPRLNGYTQGEMMGVVAPQLFDYSFCTNNSGPRHERGADERSGFLPRRRRRGESRPRGVPLPTVDLRGCLR